MCVASPFSFYRYVYRYKYDRAPRKCMSHGLLATTTGAQVIPSRLRSAHKASASKASVAYNSGSRNTSMEADGVPKPSLCPVERFKMMEMRQRPWPKPAQPAPAFVLSGKPVDQGLKMQLWALLSSGMVTLKDHLSGSSIADEARWRKEQWLPPSTGHSKNEIEQHEIEHRRDSCRGAHRAHAGPEETAQARINGAKRRWQHRLHRGSPLLQTTRPSAGQM